MKPIINKDPKQVEVMLSLISAYAIIELRYRGCFGQVLADI